MGQSFAERYLDGLEREWRKSSISYIVGQDRQSAVTSYAAVWTIGALYTTVLLGLRSRRLWVRVLCAGMAGYEISRTWFRAQQITDYLAKRIQQEKAPAQEDTMMNFLAGMTGVTPAQMHNGFLREQEARKRAREKTQR